MSEQVSFSNPATVRPFPITQEDPWQDPVTEMLLFIFSKCTVFDLGRIAQTCKKWRAVSQAAWTPLLKRYFPHYDASTMQPEEFTAKYISIERQYGNLSQFIYSVTELPPNEDGLPTNSNFEWGPTRNVAPSTTLKNNSNESLIASAGNMGCITFKSSRQGINEFALAVMDPQLISCIYAQNNILFFGCSDNAVRAMVFNQLKFPTNCDFFKYSFSGHTKAVRCLKTWGNYLISGSSDLSIRLWEIGTGKCIGTLSGHSTKVRSLEVVDDLLISGDAGNEIRLWDLTTRTCIQTISLSPADDTISKLVLDPPFLYVQRCRWIHVLILQDNMLKLLTNFPTPSIEDIVIKEGRLVVAWVQEHRITEIEMDFGKKATLKTTLEHISKWFREPGHSDSALWACFGKLDANIKKGILGCWGRILLGNPAHQSNYGRDAFYSLFQYDAQGHDLIDFLRADAIDAWIKENLK